MSQYSLDGITPILPASGNFWAAPDSILIGKVQLDENASVWWGAVLRGDNELIRVGEGSNVQDGSVLHTDMGFPLTIGKNCTIGHKTILHGCTIGDNSLIGMGATVLNGAIIGRNCLVGANALITEGKEIPDNALVVGSPGKVIRSLDDEAVKELTATAQSYVDNWKRYKTGLQELT